MGRVGKDLEVDSCSEFSSCRTIIRFIVRNVKFIVYLIFLKANIAYIVCCFIRFFFNYIFYKDFYKSIGSTLYFDNRADIGFLFGYFRTSMFLLLVVNIHKQHFSKFRCFLTVDWKYLFTSLFLYTYNFVWLEFYTNIKILCGSSIVVVSLDKYCAPYLYSTTIRFI